METLVIHPENKEQLEALKALVKSWNITFEKYPYRPDFVSEIKERSKRASKGDVVPIENPNKIWESIL